MFFAHPSQQGYRVKRGSVMKNKRRLCIKVALIACIHYLQRSTQHKVVSTTVPPLEKGELKIKKLFQFKPPNGLEMYDFHKSL